MVRSIKRIAVISKEGYREGRDLAVVFVRELQKANFEAELMNPLGVVVLRTLVRRS